MLRSPPSPAPASIPVTAPRAPASMHGLEALIRQAQTGDEAAFEALFRRHRGDVTRLVFRLLGPTPEVDDVVQDVFVHVYRSLPSFRGDAKFSTWLYRLTTNVVRMHLRRARSRPRFADVEVPEATAPEGAFGDGPETATERNERLAALRRVIDTLPEKKRTVLVLHDLQGLPAKEIAAIVEAPVLTVRTRLFYARKALYSALTAEPALASLVDAMAGTLRGRPEAREDDGGAGGRPPRGDGGAR